MAASQVPSATGIASWKLVGLWQSVSSRAESALEPSTVSISHAPARSSSGRRTNSPCDQPLQQRGHDPSRGHAEASSATTGAGSPRRVWGEVTKRCLATSLATVDGALPISRAISLAPLPRSSILSIVFLSCLVSLAYDLSDALFRPFLRFLAMAASSFLRAGPSDPWGAVFPGLIATRLAEFGRCPAEVGNLRSRIALSMLCILLIAGIFRRYNTRQADGFAPSPNP